MVYEPSFIGIKIFKKKRRRKTTPYCVSRKLARNLSLRINRNSMQRTTTSRKTLISGFKNFSFRRLQC